MTVGAPRRQYDVGYGGGGQLLPSAYMGGAVQVRGCYKLRAWRCYGGYYGWRLSCGLCDAACFWISHARMWYCSPVCVLLPRMHVPFELSLVFLILVPFGMGCACACGGVCMAQVMGDMQSDVGEMGGMRFMPPSIGHGPDGESWFIFIG